MCPFAEQDACPFDGLPEPLQLHVLSLAMQPHAARVSRGWLRLALQSGITLKLDPSLQRSDAAQAFWRKQLSSPMVRMRLQLPAPKNAGSPADWLFCNDASYPGITHLVGGAARQVQCVHDGTAQP